MDDMNNRLRRLRKIHRFDAYIEQMSMIRKGFNNLPGSLRPVVEASVLGFLIVD